ncbi:5-oxoprolinase subunit C family protein [Zavarzinella formosa]|uniref:5-oxoprolinase subunit C family protein n=1 Tax=Zavarzinella formosa TaxID=360055 RepID=UPI0002E28CB4|nr:biotin-dependent carboxyltransferase family protein [Zavarzinella formosa]
MSIRLTRPGLHTLVVDGGRPRTRSLGVPIGGPADGPSMAVANRLVGNPADCPALEITLAGPCVVTDHPVGLALFGAPFTIRRDGEEIPAGSSFTLKPGQTLDIGGTPSGCRAYLAVVGGFQVPEILGSRTGFAPLPANAELPCEPSTIPGRTLPATTFPELAAILLEQPALETPGVLRSLPGPQADWFDGSFWEREYKASPAGNRMGLRLLGEPLTRRPGELVSEAVAPGAVQITNDGLPVVLGMDGQTIGGYPKVAHVLTDELPALGRLRPGDVIRFRKLDESEVETLARQFALRREMLGRYLDRALSRKKER